MEWNVSLTKEFIKSYRRETVLWDRSHPDNRTSSVRAMAMQRMAVEFGIDHIAIEKKINNIRSQYLREIARMKVKSTQGDAYKTRWYGFKLLTFLSPDLHVEEFIKGGASDSSETEDGAASESEMELKFTSTQVTPPLSASSSQDVPSIKGTAPAPRKRKPVGHFVDCSNYTEKQYEAVKRVAEDNSGKRDIFSSYGDYVAQSLRNLNDAKLQSWARHEINNILYRAETNRMESAPKSALM